MKILKVWDSEYPWDVRAEKVSSALTEAGHRVCMVARNRERRVTREPLPECEVRRMRPWSWLPRPVDAASQFPAFFNPRWLRLIRRTAAEIAADVILVRDLPLAPTAIWAGRRLGRPVVLDMAENYPAMMQDLWLTGTTGPLDWAVRNPALVRRVERWTLERIDHVLVVVQESADRLERMGVAPEKLTVVGNTPPLGRVAQAPRPQPLPGEVCRIAYLGLMEEARGVRVLLDGLQLCRDRGMAIRADFIGDGRDRAALQAHATALGLSEVVTFHGFLPHAEALERVGKAHWGAVPHHANESWNTTIPNKLFDYMASGLAVIASDAAPVERVVGQTGGGRVFRDRDAADFARILTGTDLGEAWRLGECGRRSVAAEHHWERDVARLEGALASLVRRDPAAAAAAVRA